MALGLDGGNSATPSWDRGSSAALGWDGEKLRLHAQAEELGDSRLSSPGVQSMYVLGTRFQDLVVCDMLQDEAESSTSQCRSKKTELLQARTDGGRQF